jgi:hypothetical protein
VDKEDKKRLKNIIADMANWAGENIDWENLESDEEIEYFSGLIQEGYRLIDDL